MSSPSKALFPWSKTSNAFYPSVTNTSRLIRNARLVHLNVKFLLHSFAVIVLERRTRFVRFLRNEHEWSLPWRFVHLHRNIIRGIRSTIKYSREKKFGNPWRRIRISKSNVRLLMPLNRSPPKRNVFLRWSLLMRFASKSLLFIKDRNGRVSQPCSQQPLCCIAIVAPDSVRYLRAHELMPSQRSRMTHSSKASTPSLFPPATKVNASQTPAPVRLLNRAKVRDNPVVLRRPPRRLMINVVRETILPVAVYG